MPISTLLSEKFINEYIEGRDTDSAFDKEVLRLELVIYAATVRNKLIKSLGDSSSLNQPEEKIDVPNK